MGTKGKVDEKIEEKERREREEEERREREKERRIIQARRKELRKERRNAERCHWSNIKNLTIDTQNLLPPVRSSALLKKSASPFFPPLVPARSHL